MVRAWLHFLVVSLSTKRIYNLETYQGINYNQRELSWSVSYDAYETEGYQGACVIHWNKSPQKKTGMDSYVSSNISHVPF